MAYSDNIGKQAVSIYPYQDLDSIYGNQILQKVIEPGIYDAQVIISNILNGARITIKQGTTFVFNRSGTVDETSVNFISKIVLGEDAVLDRSGDNLWGGASALFSASIVYLIADWKYNKSSPSEKYVDFTLSGTAPAINTTDPDHKILVASFLNYQAFVLNESHPTSLIHVAYQTQANRSYLTPLKERANTFPLSFDALGSAISVGVGEGFFGGRLVKLDTSVVMNKPSQYNLVYNYVTGVTTTIDVGDLNLYYQIDFLRIKRNETTLSVAPAWESFLVLRGGTTLDFNTYSFTKNDLKNFLKTHDFLLKDEGLTLSVSIRQDLGERGLWPENTITFYEDKELLSGFNPQLISRFTLPDYLSSDIVGL